MFSYEVPLYGKVYTTPKVDSPGGVRLCWELEEPKGPKGRSERNQAGGLMPARPGRAHLGTTLEPLLGSTAPDRADVSWNTSSELSAGPFCETSPSVRLAGSSKNLKDLQDAAADHSLFLLGINVKEERRSLQGYLTYTKTHPPRTLP